MSPAVWIAVPLLVLWVMFFALIARSFRHINHHQLEELVQHSGKLDQYQKHLPRHDLMQMTAGILAILPEGVLFALIGIMTYSYLKLQVPHPLRLLVIALVGLVALVWWICEGLPDRVARFNAERIVLAVSPFMAIISIPFRPVHRLDRWLDAFFQGATDEDEEEASVQEVTDDILSAVTEGEQSGALDDEAGQMIEGVISLGQADVSEVMTPRTEIVGVPIDRLLEDVLELALSRGHSRLPVYETNLDDIVGIVLLKDLVAQLRTGVQKPLRDLMRPAYFVPESKDIPELLRELRHRKEHTAIVLDEYGGTAGLVTVEDILEEIVGEITDEHDRKSEGPIRRIDAVTVEVGPRCDIEQLNEALNLELPEDPEYDTVTGFVLHLLQRIPKPGETFDAHGVSFEVLQADERSVGRLRIRKHPPQAD